jgi:hypothetical protein
MWPFSQAGTVELEAPTLPAEQLAAVDRECREAEHQFNTDASALRSYNIENAEQPFRVRNGDVLHIQTRINDLERQRLERAFRKSYERRNQAWSTRADLMLKSGLIR